MAGIKPENVFETKPKLEILINDYSDLKSFFNQGGTSDPADGNVMHLSDSITLSVRNPPPRPQSPKKSDAKAVANILATRGITVTATAKPKEKESPKKNPSPPPPVAINLNNAVSIIPAAKGGKVRVFFLRLSTITCRYGAFPQTIS